MPPPAAMPTPLANWQWDPVTEDFFGERITDPYRWLEEETQPESDRPNQPERVRFIEWQNQRTKEWIDPVLFESTLSRLRKLLDYPRESLPMLYGEWVFTERNSGLQAQSVLYRQKGLEGKAEVLLDPNSLHEEGGISLSLFAPTQDGKWMAYGLSEGGSDEQTLRIREVATGQDLPDTFPNMRFSTVAWAADGSGFWFNRYPDPTLRENNSLYWHRLGDPVEKARLILALPEEPHLLLSPVVSWDGRYLFVATIQGTDDRMGWMWREIGGDPAAVGGWNLLQAPGHSYLSLIGTVGSKAIFLTDEGSPFRRVVTTELIPETAPVWEELVEEREGVLLEDGLLAAGKLLLSSIVDVHGQLEIRDLDGKNPQVVSLPEPGSLGGISGRPDGPEIFYQFSSLSQPGTIFKLDATTAVSTLVRRSAIAFDSSRYESRQIFVERDGARIPLFIVARRDLPKDGSHPTLLYGYGGFGVSLLPVFQPSIIPWLEAGGVYAVANIRGGGEYGAAWHEAAKLGNRPVAFADFAACAKALIEEGITSPQHLAIQGGSNGGLLVLATMQRHPELFGAVVAQVPVTDMLRFHRFGTGAFWTVEYGNPEKDAEAFVWLRSYSPLHNIRAGVPYPPTLVITADGDDRVVPAHAYKFIAAMQSEAYPGTYLLWHQTGAGHGAGKPMDMALQESALVYTFLWQALKSQPQQPQALPKGTPDE